MWWQPLIIVFFSLDTKELNIEYQSGVRWNDSRMSTRAVSYKVSKMKKINFFTLVIKIYKRHRVLTKIGRANEPGSLSDTHLKYVFHVIYKYSVVSSINYLSYTRIPAFDDFSLPDTKFKRRSAVAGGIELASIFQGSYRSIKRKKQVKIWSFFFLFNCSIFTCVMNHHSLSSFGEGGTYLNKKKSSSHWSQVLKKIINHHLQGTQFRLWHPLCNLM